MRKLCARRAGPRSRSLQGLVDQQGGPLRNGQGGPPADARRTATAAGRLRRCGTGLPRPRRYCHRPGTRTAGRIGRSRGWLTVGRCREPHEPRLGSLGRRAGQREPLRQLDVALPRPGGRRRTSVCRRRSTERILYRYRRERANGQGLALYDTEISRWQQGGFAGNGHR